MSGLPMSGSLTSSLSRLGASVVKIWWRSCRKLHRVHKGWHDGFILVGWRRPGGRWSLRGDRLVWLWRRHQGEQLSSLNLGATRPTNLYSCPTLGPVSKCLRSEVWSRSVCRVCRLWRLHHLLYRVVGGFHMVGCGSLHTLNRGRGNLPWLQTGELLAEEWRLLVQETLLSSSVRSSLACSCH